MLNGESPDFFVGNAFMHSASARAFPRHLEWRNIEKSIPQGAEIAVPWGMRHNHGENILRLKRRTDSSGQEAHQADLFELQKS